MRRWCGSSISTACCTGAPSRGEDVIFATNNAGSRISDVEAKLGAFGVDAEGSVISAAQGAAALLTPGERVLVVGGPGLHEEVTRRGCEVVERGPADAVVCGLDVGLTYEKLNEANLAIRAGARFVAANPDVSYPTPRGLEMGGGSIAAAIAAASQTTPTFGGKPDGAMVAMIHDRFGPGGIVVGDRPDTDGLFAVTLGYRFGLVFSGVTTPDDLPVTPTPDVTAPDLAALVAATA